MTTTAPATAILWLRLYAEWMGDCAAFHNSNNHYDHPTVRMSTTTLPATTANNSKTSSSSSSSSSSRANIEIQRHQRQQKVIWDALKALQQRLAALRNTDDNDAAATDAAQNKPGPNSYKNDDHDHDNNGPKDSYCLVNNQQMEENIQDNQHHYHHDRHVDEKDSYDVCCQDSVKVLFSASSSSSARTSYSIEEIALLHCLGYIWMRSSSQLWYWCESSNNYNINNNDNNSHYDEWQDWIHFLSIHYGESAEPWLCWYENDENDENDDRNNSIRDLVLATLQRWNIVSVVVAGEDEPQTCWPLQKKSTQQGKDETYDNYTTITQQSQQQLLQQLALQGWPFHPLYSLRRAVGRIESSDLGLPPNVDSSSNGNNIFKLLLSHEPIDDFTTSNTKKTNEVISNSRSPSDQSYSAVPILYYIHDEEIYSHIFSFCSYKRLGRLQQVCQLWNSTIDHRSNSIWKDAYMSRFSPAMDSTPISISRISYMSSTSSSTVSWKDLFYHKHVAEMSIKHQRHAKTGFKFRTCPHVGCLLVIKSERQQSQHLDKHRHEQEKSNRKSKKVDSKSNNNNNKIRKKKKKKTDIIIDSKQLKRTQKRPTPVVNDAIVRPHKKASL
jgi:hypothetical protein